MSILICILAFAILWARGIITPEELFTLTLGSVIGVATHWAYTHIICSSSQPYEHKRPN